MDGSLWRVCNCVRLDDPASITIEHADRVVTGFEFIYRINPVDDSWILSSIGIIFKIRSNWDIIYTLPLDPSLPGWVLNLAAKFYPTASESVS